MLSDPSLHLIMKNACHRPRPKILLTRSEKEGVISGGLSKAFEKNVIDGALDVYNSLAPAAALAVEVSDLTEAPLRFAARLWHRHDTFVV